jgi:hypothetical protein
MMLRKLMSATVAVLAPVLAQAGIPMLNATCPAGIEVNADAVGQDCINGQQARLEKSNDNHCEASGADVVVSISINPGGSPALSHNGKHGANGV